MPEAFKHKLTGCVNNRISVKLCNDDQQKRNYLSSVHTQTVHRYPHCCGLVRSANRYVRTVLYRHWMEGRGPLDIPHGGQ